MGAVVGIDVAGGGAGGADDSARGEADDGGLNDLVMTHPTHRHREHARSYRGLRGCSRQARKPAPDARNTVPVRIFAINHFSSAHL